MPERSKERRQAPRATCRRPCCIVQDGIRIPARIADVSESGLCVLTQVYLEPRRVVDMKIELPSGSGESYVRAQVWHVRRERLRPSNRRIWVVGMMIEEADAAYQRLLDMAGIARDEVQTSEPHSHRLRLAAPDAARPRDDDSTLPARSRRAPTLEDTIATRSFRIRVKSIDGPRTRLLTLSADSENEARRLAERDLAGAWSILDVYPT